MDLVYNKYISKIINYYKDNTWDSSEENTIETINNIKDNSIKDWCNGAISITTGYKFKNKIQRV